MSNSNRILCISLHQHSRASISAHLWATRNSSPQHCPIMHHNARHGQDAQLMFTRRIQMETCYSDDADHMVWSLKNKWTDRKLMQYAIKWCCEEMSAMMTEVIEEWRDSLKLKGTTDHKHANNSLAQQSCIVEEDSVKQEELWQHEATLGSCHVSYWTTR